MWGVRVCVGEIVCVCGWVGERVWGVREYMCG